MKLEYSSEDANGIKIDGTVEIPDGVSWHDIDAALSFISYLVEEQYYNEKAKSE